ncbi:uncharacterized protein LOC142224724 [Haematobia irritans]|uniref:uncharacterized protein LOC142224724 n=1 Tax=Haematobia irritans TaxID=7368 RepID=UPI003F4FDC0E
MASFRILVPEDIFDIVVKPDFWPPRTVVHEFVYKPNPKKDVVRLPTIPTTETWLKSNVNNSEFFCSKYQIFRCDRFNESKKTGGGVLIAISIEFPSEQILISNNCNIELVAVKVRVNNLYMYISCSYIPPNSDILVYNDLTSYILSAFNSSKPSDFVLAFGDFNLPLIIWKQSIDSNVLYLLRKISLMCSENYNSKRKWASLEQSKACEIENRKNKFFKNFRKLGSLSSYSKYAIARSEYNLECRAPYRNYLVLMRHQIKTNPKNFYKFVNSKRRTGVLPNYLKNGSLMAEGDKDICCMFANYFASTYSCQVYDTSAGYPFHISHSSGISASLLSVDIVLNNLKSLKCSYKPCPDGIPPNILKFCADNLKVALTKIFNTPISFSYVPEIWKQSYITPLLKSGSRFEVSNYRGIAKLCALPKLLEKMLADSISHQISSVL